MRRTLVSIALGLCLASAGPVVANGVSGAYLAARQAAFTGDFRAAANYYSEAIMFEPERAELLERATLAYLSMGNMERASAYGTRLEAAGFRSQVAQMAVFGELAGRDAYAEILDRMNDSRGVGPLVDGLALAWLQLGQGDMSAALVAFDEVSQQRGMAGFAGYHKGMALASVGDFENAAMVLADDQTGAMRSTRRGVMAQAQILSQLDRQADALALIEQAFGTRDLDPGLRAMVDALQQGQALPFTQVTSARDGLAEVFFTLAGALANEADEDFTLLYARLAQHLRPDHTDAILLTASLLEQLDQLDLAVETYKKVSGDDPSYHAAELGRAGALRRNDQPEDAIEVLQQLAQTHGDLAIVHSNLGDTLRQLERFEDAKASYDTAIGLIDPEDRRQWFLLYARGITNERLDNWPEAEADFRRALDLNPDQPQVLNYLGYSLVQKQIKLDEALEMIERAVAGNPDSGYIVDSLGWALYTLGRYEEAVPQMERATELMPVDPVVNDHLGDVYWAVGREMEARFQWRRALSFIDFGTAAEEIDPERVRRKLEVGLDQVLADEGAPPLKVANDDN